MIPCSVTSRWRMSGVSSLLVSSDPVLDLYPLEDYVRTLLAGQLPSFWYPSGDNFGTFAWPSREEIESLLVSVG